MRILAILLVFLSSIANAVGVKIFSNQEIRDQYNIRVELAEKHTHECNDFVVYAPLEINDVELGELSLEKIEKTLIDSIPDVDKILKEKTNKALNVSEENGYGRVLGCITKNELSNTYLRFLYVNPGAPSLILVAPLM